MYGQSGTEALQLSPQGIIVRMSEVVTLDKHRAKERAAEARHLCCPPQLLNRVVHVLDWNHRCCEESIRSSLAKVRDPVVVSARESVGDIGIFYEMESFGEPGGIHESLVDAHRVH